MSWWVRRPRLYKIISYIPVLEHELLSIATSVLVLLVVVAAVELRKER